MRRLVYKLVLDYPDEVTGPASLIAQSVRTILAEDLSATRIDVYPMSEEKIDDARH